MPGSAAVDETLNGRPELTASRSSAITTPAAISSRRVPRRICMGANPWPSVPKSFQPGTRQYVVVQGDSFHKIAKANKVSMKALADANPGVDSAKLRVGQLLLVPASAEPATASSGASPVRVSGTASQTAGRYVVKSGDTLDRIARAHGTTVRAIKAANGLTSDNIVAGQNLKLPGSRTAGTSSGRG